jgi:phenylalanyl-tRNA synthetase beta chain
MKLPLSMIKSFISIDLPTAKIEETLSLLGIEVDAIYAPQPPFSGVVVGEVKSARRHPAAEKLQVTEVFDGKETFQVVCGAPNCRAGMRTAFAKAGAHLLEGGKLRTIEKASIRGVESFGMLCSAPELSLYEDASGILDLPIDFPLGADCVGLLWDPVFEISLTPNLGHCMSALGIARELSAALQKPLHKKHAKLVESAARRIQTKVDVKAEALCPRYMARVIENIQVGPSPFWLQRELMAAGQRSINNVVDVTNYILLKYGQPMHAFDADKLAGGAIVVDTAKTSQRFAALSGVELEIPVGALLICDAEKPVAIAGVIGGSSSAVSNATQTVLLEAASFDPISVRSTSKKVGVRTDSSLRFEKGVDPSSIPEYLDEAAALLANISGGKIAAGVVDCKKKSFVPKQIRCRPNRVNQVLGTKLSESEIEAIFRRLGFGLGEGLLVEVPLYRNDISEEIDLIEEVARIYGYNHIERPLPRATTAQIPHDPAYLFESELRRRLVALGLSEFLTCDLISPKLARIAQELSHEKNVLLETLHSKSEEYSILRPSLLPGLLQVIRTNLDQKNQQIAAFEIGRIHFQQDGSPIEFPMCAILLSGKEYSTHWDRKPASVDFYDLKGIAENLLEGLHISSCEFVPSKHPTFHPGRQADLIASGLRIGSIGELHPELLAKVDIHQKVYYAELNAQYLQKLQGPPPKMKPLPQFPSSERDWTVPQDPKANIAALLAAIEKSSTPLLEKFEVIDLYRGEGKTNVTLRFTYRDKAKTVSFEEVEGAHSKMVEEAVAILASRAKFDGFDVGSRSPQVDISDRP